MRDDDLYLADIVEAGDAIRRMVGDVPFERCGADEVLVAAVEMKLVVIAEAFGSLMERSQALYRTYRSWSHAEQSLQTSCWGTFARLEERRKHSGM